MQSTRYEQAIKVLGLVALLFVVACGGGAGRDDREPNPDDGGGGTGGGGDLPGMVLPPFDATTLSGGVLATFAVGQEKFRGWFTRAENTQRLVDAFAGRAAPVTSVCMRLRSGAGAMQHNAPWTWSVDTLLPSSLDGSCAACASSWPTPSAAEAGMNSATPFNCVIQSGNAVGMESRAYMQVTLIDVADRR